MSSTSVDLAVARAHQVEIADEPPDGRGGQPLGARLVADLVVERRDLGHEVRLALGVDDLDDEAPGRRGQQVVAAVRVATGLADLGEGARRRPASRRACVPTSRPSRMSTTPNGSPVSRQRWVIAR